MSRACLVIVVLWGAVAQASPPSGYRCGKGKPKPGVGCACPAGMVEKRDGENNATCVTAKPKVARTPPKPPEPAPAPAGPQPDGRVALKSDRIEILEQIRFVLNRGTIRPESFRILDGIAATLLANPNVRLRIEGHTDSLGADDHNQKLGEVRAQSVRSYLVKRGIDAGRLEAVGVGEMSPIASNRTEAGRALNRRIEFHIVP